MKPEVGPAIFKEGVTEKQMLPEAQPSVSLRWIRCGSSRFPLFATESCPSSMDMAWYLSRNFCFPDWASVLSAAQSSGRGQFGRTWYSPAGNLYGTVRIPRPGPVWNDLVPLILAEAMRRVLKRLGVAPTIKWPNDLIIDGKKIGGILLETRSDVVMAGLGLNLVSAPHPSELRHPLALPAGYLEAFGLKLKPVKVWIPFIREARSLIRDTLRGGDPRRFVGCLTPHMAYMGESILLDAYAAGGQPVVFQGLDASGAIKVLTAEGERVFHSGSMYPVMYR